MDCNFCGRGIPKGTEYIHVTTKGKAIYVCSSKCLKNMVKLNRKPRDTPWTKEYRIEKEARLKLLGQQQKPEAKPAAKTQEPKQKEEKPQDKKVQKEKAKPTVSDKPAKKPEKKKAKKASKK